MNGRSFLFLLKSYPDIDHMAPMIWNCLRRGDRAWVVFEAPYDWRNDYRIQLLLDFPNCRILTLAGVSSSSRAVRLLSRLRWTPRTLRRLLAAKAIDLCFVEWGPGIGGDAGAPFGTRLRRRRQFRRDRASLLVDIADELLAPLRYALLRACRDADIPTVALPHGISTKMEAAYNPKIAERMAQAGGVLPQQDRNSFAVWVHNTERERDINVNMGGMRPDIAQVWGSLRFSPQWMEVMRTACPPASVPDRPASGLRVVFFLPKWRNNADRPATIELLRQLAGRGDVQLVLKAHPRPGTSELGDAELDVLAREPNVCIAAYNDHSAALVTAADVVIDIGSGMALDAVLQQRHLIYPVYLHTNRLAFDEWGGCLFARSHAEVHEHIDRIGARVQSVLAGEEVAPLVRHLAYGGRARYDIPEYYYSRTTALLECAESSERIALVSQNA